MELELAHILMLFIFIPLGIYEYKKIGGDNPYKHNKKDILN